MHQPRRLAPRNRTARHRRLSIPPRPATRRPPRWTDRASGRCTVAPTGMHPRRGMAPCHGAPKSYAKTAQCPAPWPSGSGAEDFPLGPVPVPVADPAGRRIGRASPAWMPSSRHSAPGPSTARTSSRPCAPRGLAPGHGAFGRRLTPDPSARHACRLCVQCRRAEGAILCQGEPVGSGRRLWRKSRILTRLIASAAIVLFASACATRGFVRTEDAVVDTKVDTLAAAVDQAQARTSERIDQVDQRGQAAAAAAQMSQAAADAAQTTADAVGGRVAEVESGPRHADHGGDDRRGARWIRQRPVRVASRRGGPARSAGAPAPGGGPGGRRSSRSRGTPTTPATISTTWASARGAPRPSSATSTSSMTSRCTG